MNLGSSNKLVAMDFTKLLRDEDEEVLQAIVPNIGLILEFFAVSGVLNKGNRFIELTKLYIKTYK